MLQIWLEELTKHIQGTIDGKLLERVQRALVQLNMSEFASFVDFIQFAGNLKVNQSKSVLLQNLQGIVKFTHFLVQAVLQELGIILCTFAISTIIGFLVNVI